MAPTCSDGPDRAVGHLHGVLSTISPEIDVAGDSGLNFSSQGYCRRGGGATILTRLAISRPLEKPDETPAFRLTSPQCGTSRCRWCEPSIASGGDIEGQVQNEPSRRRRFKLKKPSARSMIAHSVLDLLGGGATVLRAILATLMVLLIGAPAQPVRAFRGRPQGLAARVTLKCLCQGEEGRHSLS